MYRPALRKKVSQGDIFDDLPYTRIREEGLLAVVKLERGILLTHDCEYDKPGTTAIMIAVVRSVAEQSPRYQDSIRGRGVASAFYLEAVQGILPESFVDLRTITVIDKRIIIVRVNEGKRLISMTQEARIALQEQLFFFFGREMDDDE
jgi:hypothetical protein